jgi:uncharacterized iron-regulated membrane protein
MSITNILRGIGGEFEINRVVGAFGGFAYIVGAHAFLAWDIHRGAHFDLPTYCLTFPAGLAAVVGAIAGAVALKDRNVAIARQKQAEPPLDDKAGQS